MIKKKRDEERRGKSNDSLRWSRLDHKQARHAQLSIFSSISTIAHFGPLLYFSPTSHRHAAPLESDVECLSGKRVKGA